MTDFFRSKAFERGKPRTWVLDQEDYTHYVVWWPTANKNAARVESGWSFKEDATDRLNDLREENEGRSITARVYARGSLKRLGLDPSGEPAWADVPRRTA